VKQNTVSTILDRYYQRYLWYRIDLLSQCTVLSELERICC
jgi:hypothetical protein